MDTIQKLYDRTPQVVVHFLAGSLPTTAILHLKQLSLFGMITRLPGSILHRIAQYTLTTAKDSSKSWFIHISNLTLKYQLPHPLTLLQNPPSKLSLKKFVQVESDQLFGDPTQRRVLQSHLSHLLQTKVYVPCQTSPPLDNMWEQFI